MTPFLPTPPWQRSLRLVAAALLPLIALMLLSLPPAAQAFWSKPTAATWPEYLRRCMPLYNTRPPQTDEARRRIVFNEAILFASAGGEQQTMNLLPGLAAARSPVLVIAGTCDPVCPLADARDIAAALPPQWMQFEAFEGAGHGVWRDRPEAGLACLRAFIAGAARSLSAS